MQHLKKNNIYEGNSIELLKSIKKNSVTSCITDPPYNYEFIDKAWNVEEIKEGLAE